MSRMRPILKRLHSPDIFDLDSFCPDDEECFGFLLQAMFGLENTEGEESFDIFVCTPKWLEKELSEKTIISGRHNIIIKNYDIENIRSFLIQYARRCGGETWQDVAVMLGRIGKWEFEDYVP